MPIPTIIQRVIGGNPQNAIALANSQFARPVSLPANWSKIRLGWTWHMTNTGANIAQGQFFLAGFGSGTTATVGDISTTNFIGLKILPTVTWTFNAYPYYSMTSGTLMKRVGSTTTNGSGDIFGGGTSLKIGAGAATATDDITPFWLDITKGSPNYTAQAVYYGSTTPQTHTITEAQFKTQTMSLVPTFNTTQGTARTVAFDEVAGTLNSVQIYWSSAQAQIEIVNLCVAVLELA